MAHDQRTQLIVETFLKVVDRRNEPADPADSLKAGLQLRQQFQDAIQAGTVPVHPRFEWVRKQARAILELLLTLPPDYEKACPGAPDRISMADLLDVCDMAHGHVVGIIKAGILDPRAVELVPYEEVTQSIGPADPAAAIKGEPWEDEDEP